jgi:hypothetical protein
MPNPSGRPGNIYTRQDRDFFVDFIQYELTKDPELGKAELCDMLHRKAPHHTADSWKSHWSSRHAVADNILRLAAERVAASNRAAGRTVTDTEVPRKAVSRAALTSKPLTAAQAKAARVESPSETDDEDDEDVATDWTEFDNQSKQMGGKDAVLTEMDMREMAKYVATFHANAWKNSKNRTRWQAFAEKVCKCSSPCVRYV